MADRIEDGKDVPQTQISAGPVLRGFPATDQEATALVQEFFQSPVGEKFPATAKEMRHKLVKIGVLSPLLLAVLPDETDTLVSGLHQVALTAQSLPNMASALSAAAREQVVAFEQTHHEVISIARGLNTPDVLLKVLKVGLRATEVVMETESIEKLVSLHDNGAEGVNSEVIKRVLLKKLLAEAQVDVIFASGTKNHFLDPDKITNLNRIAQKYGVTILYARKYSGADASHTHQLSLQPKGFRLKDGATDAGENTVLGV